jgi:hypothetical protein
VRKGNSTERLCQELQLLVEYLQAVQEPDVTFLRIHAELLLAHIDSLADQTSNQTLKLAA